MWLHSLVSVLVLGIHSSRTNLPSLQSRIPPSCLPPSYFILGTSAAELGYAMHDLRDALRLETSPLFCMASLLVASSLFCLRSCSPPRDSRPQYAYQFHLSQSPTRRFWASRQCCHRCLVRPELLHHAPSSAARAVDRLPTACTGLRLSLVGRMHAWRACRSHCARRWLRHAWTQRILGLADCDAAARSSVVA